MSSQGPSSSPIKVTFVEAGGSGGVYQHTLAVAEGLALAGFEVTIVTADEVEVKPRWAKIRPTLAWHRGGRLRGPRVAASFIARVVPRAVRAQGVVWVQGGFKTPLTAILICTLRAFRKRVVFSPHNLFVRGDQPRWSLIGLRTCIRFASVVVAYNSSDYERLIVGRHKTTLLPLIMYAPPVDPEQLSVWAKIAADRDIRVAALGQIRADKNLPMLVAACAAADVGLLVAGTDRGDSAGAVLDAIADTSARVLVQDQYFDLGEFVAMMVAIGCVALPYGVASQSAVASLARTYGVQVIGHPIGGLGEQLTTKVESLEIRDWAAALAVLPDTRWRGPQIPTPSTAPEIAAYGRFLATLSSQRPGRSKLRRRGQN